MTEKIKRINNPLTIIAIFAALAEVNATIAIGLIDPSLHYIFIWFVIGFPSILVILFFITLNFNTKVMYSPSDYKDDKSFMDSLFGNYYGDSKSEKDEKDELDTTKLASEIESKITEKLQKKLNESIKDSKNPEIQKEIDSLKEQIKNVADQTVIEVKSMFAIPTDLKEILLSFYRFPAFYMVIYALVRSKATSIDRLKSFSRKYYLPGDWENGAIPQLFEKEILLGTESKFSINEDFQEHLDNWVDQNSNKLKAMNNAFRMEENDDDDVDRKKHRDRVKELSSRLKF
jgi:hypothetical protein